MGQASLSVFFAFVSIILAVLISGIVFFVFQYRKKKLLFEKEKREIEEQHQLILLNAQLESQRQTMQHIGEEIHDSVAQKLTLASIYAQRMEFESTEAGTGERLFGISKIINDSLIELRQLSKSLTDSKLQKASLNELIQVECDQVNATGICAIVYKANEIPEINIAEKSSLLRIIQEFIQNSIKHSGCNKIDIILTWVNNYLVIELKDNGKGFDVEDAQHKGIGLDNIRRRIQILDGSYTFKSQINKGTFLNIKIPLQIL